MLQYCGVLLLLVFPLSPQAMLCHSVIVTFWGGGIRKTLRYEVEKNSVLIVSEVPQPCMRTSDV